jgi:hypothetical protein
MKRTLLSAAAAAAFFFAAPAAAQQGNWEAQVRNQIVEAAKRLENQGLSMVQPIRTGSLNQDATQAITLSLEIGREYHILGACDNDCTDVDLALFDASGRQVSIDAAEDDYPVVSVSPPRSGTYRVVVSMAKCSSEPCRYGVGVFAK